MSRRVLLAAQLLAGFLAERNYRALPALSGTVADEERGHVSIVIPARDEAHNLPRLLDSLGRLRYPSYEIVVVDDGSTDGTGEIARRFGVRTIRLDALPAGWAGKSFACQTGADATSGGWLLFTDADTDHAPRSLGLAVSAAAQSGAGLVSLLARQRCESFWERLLLPYVYALYFAGAIRVNQPGGTPIANGQYMLFRRDAYERVGGHTTVRDSLIEDVALAHAAARRGIRVLLLRGEEQVGVRMYADLGSLREGFGKNALRFIAISPRSGVLTVAATIAFGAAVPRAIGSDRSWLAALLVPAAMLAPWMRRFDVPLYYALLFPLAAAVFGFIGLESTARALARRTAWKGRRY